MKDVKIILGTILILMLLLYTTVFSTYYKLNKKINNINVKITELEKE